MLKLTPGQLSKIGNTLIWIGVLAWLPFFALRMAGGKPPVMAFLVLHLVGVIGGSRVKKIGVPAPKVRPKYQVVAHSLIFIGVLMWVPYAYLKVAHPETANVTPYLVLHLSFIFPAIIILYGGKLFSALKEKNEQEQPALKKYS